MTKISKGCIRF